MRGWVCLVVLLVATACSSSPQGDSAIAAGTPTADVVEPTTPLTSGSSPTMEAVEPAAPGPPPTAAQTPTAERSDRAIDPAEFDLNRAIGIADRHGLFFFPANPDRPQVALPSSCESSTSFLMVGAADLAGVVTVPGDQVYRVDFGSDGWGFAAVRCANDFSIVPLRITDGDVSVVTDPETSMPVEFDGRAEHMILGNAIESSLWVSSSTMRLLGPQGEVTEVLNLETGQVAPLPELPLQTRFSPGERQAVATEATAPFLYYLPFLDRSCHRSSAELVPAIHVVLDDKATPVTTDLDSLRSITQIVFGPDSQVGWLTNCYGVHTVWHAAVDPATGHFDDITQLVDAQWSLDNGWVDASGGTVGPTAIAFDATGSLVAWARTLRGFEGVQLVPHEAPPVVIIESGGEIAPEPVAPLESPVLVGSPSDVSVVDLANPRPPGTAERNGLVFYGRTMDDRLPAEACAESVSPVYAFGESPTPWHVANLRGDYVSRFDVDRNGRLRAVTGCGETTFVTTGIFDFEAMAIVAESVRAWQRPSTSPAPVDDPSGQLRWGAYLLDPDTSDWTDERQAFDTSFYKGASDSGRFRYFSERGFYGDSKSGEPADPDVRVIVEDTESGEQRPAFDDPMAIRAWRFIFGPGDEVAWMEGNELGTFAVLGRIDPNTGEIVDVQRLTHPYWGYPRSGSGDPGPDAIAFEADGRLRAWAYTYEPGEPDQSTWRIESLTFSLDS